MNEHAYASLMRRCLTLAARGDSRVIPNPRVGAVVANTSGTVLGEGWHARCGGPHAEVLALRDAAGRHGRKATRGATLLVNLEPCSHHGKTPPCVDAIQAHGIAHVVAGMADPNPRARGGAELLRSHGIGVTVGILEPLCHRLNEPFLHSLRHQRPLVTLKVAQTADGYVHSPSGHARWITGPPARRQVHRWRAESDGILVGSGTARRDNPSLTVRHVRGPNPHRFVLDGSGTLPAHLDLFTDGEKTTALVGRGTAPAYAPALRAQEGTLIRVPRRGDHLNLAEALARLEVQNLLVEAGPGLASALLSQDLVDRLCIFIAPKVLGNGRVAFRGLKTRVMEDARTFVEHSWEAIGEDMLLRGYFRAI